MRGILFSTINTSEMERRVLDAFEVSDWYRGHAYTASFEHGQWWITDLDSGTQWAVCDAAGSGAIDGFWFEQVSEGDA